MLLVEHISKRRGLINSTLSNSLFTSENIYLLFFFFFNVSTDAFSHKVLTLRMQAQPFLTQS